MAATGVSLAEKLSAIQISSTSLKGTVNACHARTIADLGVETFANTGPGSWAMTFATFQSTVNDYLEVISHGLDVFQATLDAAGFIPVLGFVPDLMNSGICLLRDSLRRLRPEIVDAVDGPVDEDLPGL